MDFDNFFIPADEKHIKAEKAKARDLRKSQWFKNRKGQGSCHYCKQRFHPSDLTMDHVVPIVRGGKTTKNNCVACCKECNNQKKYLLPIEWNEYLAKLKEEADKKLS
jgi:5-methylcytosine-specific restriction endonuclease McrA